MWVATSSSAPMRSFSAVTAVRLVMYSLRSRSICWMESLRVSTSSPVRMRRREMADSPFRSPLRSSTKERAAAESWLMGLIRALFTPNRMTAISTTTATPISSVTLRR